MHLKRHAPAARRYQRCVADPLQGVAEPLIRANQNAIPMKRLAAPLRVTQAARPFRLRLPPLLGQQQMRRAKPLMRLAMVRIELDGAPAVLDRAPDIALLIKRAAQFVVGVGACRIDSESASSSFAKLLRVARETDRRGQDLL